MLAGNDLFIFEGCDINKKFIAWYFIVYAI